MEKRAFLAIVLSMLVLLFWQMFYAPPPKVAPPAKSEPTSQDASRETPPSPQQAAKETTAPRAAAESSPPAPATVPSLTLPSTKPLRDVVVETPLYRAVFTETGARLKSFALKKYRETIDRNSPDKELVRNQKLEELPLAFNFLNHPVASLELAPYTADLTSVTLKAGDEPKHLAFTYEAPGWLRIKREYTFYPDSCRVDLAITVTNLGNQPLEDAPALSLINAPFSSKGGRYNFQGPALLVNETLEEVKPDKIKQGKTFPGLVDWVAYTDQYFIMALVPVNLEKTRAQLNVLASADSKVKSVLIGDKSIIQPGQEQRFEFKFYGGPKEVKTLKAADPKLARAVNFGWFDVIAQPLLLCLHFFYRFTHNYGVAIILLTILIKILFWPLTHKSYVSMQAMKKLQPQMAKIREKYKDNKEKMNQELMQLYRSHKVNPLGGCLPMLLQIPVFFALYRVLYSSITMRHAPFIWWINDLSAPDRLPVGFNIPYLGGLPVLTLLMGVSMFIQQKMTPTTGDPRQEKMMLMMPVVFTFFFINFPSGLVLYWLVNNILTIAQQYYINKKAAPTR